MSKNLLIGSRALAYWDRNFELKGDRDWDVVTDRDLDWAECHSYDQLDNRSLLAYVSDLHTVYHNGTELHVVNPVGLSIVKRSHLWRDLGFQKHITQYHRHLAKYRSLYSSIDWSRLEDRTKLTMLGYPKTTPNLNQSVDSFFDDAVKKTYNHDWLHTLVAYESQPMYTRLQTDANWAWCKEDLWHGLSQLQKDQCVSEESMVIAIERYLVPSQWRYPPKLAYLKSLDRVCTTLCSGWFRDHAIDYYPQVVDLFDLSRFNLVKTQIEKTYD